MRLFEIVQLLLPARRSMPVVLLVALKKSKMLLLSMTSPRLTVLLPAVPRPVTAFIGRFAPAGPMLFAVIVLLLLPEPTVAPVVVLNRTAPPAEPVATVDEPRMEQFFTVLFDAPLMKRIVLVGAAAPRSE